MNSDVDFCEQGITAEGPTKGYDEDFTPKAFERDRLQADEDGFEVVFVDPELSDNTCILVDLDGRNLQGTDDEVCAQLMLMFNKRLHKMERVFPSLYLKEFWRSKSGRGLHMVLYVTEPLPWPIRSLIAIHLGSDIKREYCSLRRYTNGVPEPWMLFKPQTADRRA